VKENHHPLVIVEDWVFGLGSGGRTRMNGIKAVYPSINLVKYRSEPMVRVGKRGKGLKVVERDKMASWTTKILTIQMWGSSLRGVHVVVEGMTKEVNASPPHPNQQHKPQPPTLLKKS